MEKYEDALMSVVSEHQAKGLSFDELISGLELRIMALREEEQAAESEDEE